MSMYDIAMLILFGGAAFFGYQRGLMRQVASIASIVIGYLVAVNFREPMSKVITAEEPWNKIAAMAILFVATSLLIWSIYASAQKSLKRMELKGFDHQLGGLFGAAKGVLLCCLVTMFAVSLLGPKVHQAIHESKSGYIVVRTIYQVAAIVPQEIWPYIDPHFQRFNQSIGTSDNLQRFQNYSAIEQGTQDPRQAPRYSGQWVLPADNRQALPNTQLPQLSPSPTDPSNRANRTTEDLWNELSGDFLGEIQDVVRDPRNRAAAEKAWEWMQRQGGDR